MSGAPTFTKFDYRLRPAKNVERKMICEALGLLASFDSFKKYRYVGFGSVGFNDFTLFHQRLGIKDMVSIEDEVDHEERFNKNKPYSCVKLVFGKATKILPTMTWTERNIVWLDYEAALDEDAVADASYLSANLRSGSMLLITLNADTSDTIPGAAKKKFDSLKKLVGQSMIRLGVGESDVVSWGFARVCRDVLADIIQTTLTARNGGLSPKDQLAFMPLFNFNYQDGSRMMTFGGAFVSKKEEALFPSATFDDLAFIRRKSEALEIKIPVLTIREIKFLDELLPHHDVGGAQPAWIPLEHRKRYRDVYRYFPYFHELEPA